MPRVHDLCSRIQNGFRARLRLLSLPETRLNLSICQVLLRAGLLASITRGTHLGPDTTPTPTTTANLPTRRYWLELKYTDGAPVVREVRCVSKPSRRVIVGKRELERLMAGGRVQGAKELVPGEVVVVGTRRGVVELEEAVRMGCGGELLCRAR